jgi:hypothetical protein
VGKEVWAGRGQGQRNGNSIIYTHNRLEPQRSPLWLRKRGRSENMEITRKSSNKKPVNTEYLGKGRNNLVCFFSCSF